mmetsp:Transcript_131587/g.319770  ORF Transcript_131587/g.319770 Transcript_131587/m.319770 type:complete len:237 (+) Transcript_131587:297-1007(+)
MTFRSCSAYPTSVSSSAPERSTSYRSNIAMIVSGGNTIGSIFFVLFVGVSLGDPAGAHDATRLATCPNVTLCSVANSARALRKLPSSQESDLNCVGAVFEKHRSAAFAETCPPTRPHALHIFRKSTLPRESLFAPLTTNPSYADLSGSAASLSEYPSGTATFFFFVPPVVRRCSLSSSTRWMSFSNSSTSNPPLSSSSNSSNSSAACVARTSSMTPRSASAKPTSVSSSVPLPSAS